MDQINIDNPFEKSGYEGEKKLRIGQKKKKCGKDEGFVLFIYLFILKTGVAGAPVYSDEKDPLGMKSSKLEEIEEIVHRWRNEKRKTSSLLT